MFEPSVEMVEAAARASHNFADAPRKWDDEDAETRGWYCDLARAVLVAAFSATVQEPCPTCEGVTFAVLDGESLTMPDHTCPAPVPVWLRDVQANGLVEVVTRVLLCSTPGQIVWHNIPPMFRVGPSEETA